MSNSIEKITEIKKIFEDIASAIVAQGVSIGRCEGPSTYADKIMQIDTCNHDPNPPDGPNYELDIICDDTNIIAPFNGLTKKVLVWYYGWTTIYTPSIKYESGDDWLQFDCVLENEIIYEYQLTVSKNTSSEKRVAKITVSCEDDINIKSLVITVTQNAEDIEPVSITIEKDSIVIPEEGGEINAQVQYSYATSIDEPSINGEWIVLSNSEETKKDENTVIVNYTFTASKNEIEDRTGNITFNARGKKDSSDSAQVAISQKKIITPESVITYKLEMQETLSINDGDIEHISVTAFKYSDDVLIWEDEVSTDNACKWTSSDYNIASVISGDVIGKSVGTAIITATYEGVSKECTVTVNERPIDPVSKVTLNPTTIELDYFAGYSATADAIFENAAPHSVVSNEYCKVEYVESEDVNRHVYKFTSLLNGPSNSIQTSVQIKYTNTLTGNVEILDVPVTINKAPEATLNVDPTEVNFTYGGGNKEVKVTTTNTATYYTTTEDLDWLTVDTYGNKIILTAEANESTEPRSGRVIVSCEGPDHTEKQAFITVTQDGKVETEDPKPMYYGYIPKEIRSKYGWTASQGYSTITGDWIKDAVELGTVKKIDQATTMGKTSFGVVPKKSLLLIAVPSGEYVVTKDDADGNKVPFRIEPFSNGEYSDTIDGFAYSFYGEYQKIDIENNKYFYIDKK